MCRVLVVACGIYVPWSGIRSGLPELGAWSLNHWITREAPHILLLNWCCHPSVSPLMIQMLYCENFSTCSLYCPKLFLSVLNIIFLYFLPIPNAYTELWVDTVRQYLTVLMNGLIIWHYMLIKSINFFKVHLNYGIILCLCFGIYFWYSRSFKKWKEFQKMKEVSLDFWEVLADHHLLKCARKMWESLSLLLNCQWNFKDVLNVKKH